MWQQVLLCSIINECGEEGCGDEEESRTSKAKRREMPTLLDSSGELVLH